MNLKFMKVSRFEETERLQEKMNFFTIFKFFEMYLYIQKLLTATQHRTYLESKMMNLHFASMHLEKLITYPIGLLCQNTINITDSMPVNI